MVKKTLLVILVVVVGITAGLGLAIGSQLDAGDSTAPAQESSDGGATEPSSTPTPEATASTTDSTVDEAEPTATQTPVRTSVPAREFSEKAIASSLESYVNQERTSRGLNELSTDGRTVDQLTAMATDHSETMAVEGQTIHAAGGLTSAERYEKNGLYETCKFKAVGKSYVVTPDDNTLEVLGRTVAGHTYEAGGTTKFNADDQDVAKAIFDEWMATTTYRDRLLRDGITRIGIGVEVTDTGYVYVTANTCG